MKKIEAVIRASKLDEVKQALHLHGIDGMTISEVRGLGRDKGRSVVYRGVQAAQTMVPRIKLETVVENDYADEAIDAIYRAAYTGEVGDGRILVTDLENVIRIRMGETEADLYPVAH